jgi:type VI secretion system secreted protein Hcp
MAEIFLRLDDILGESLDAVGGGPPHMDDIEVVTWNWKLTNDAPLKMTSAERTTHTSCEALTITKGVDKASVTLMQYCAMGTLIPTATLTCRKNTSYEKLEFLVVDFKKVKVMDVKWESHGLEHNMSEIVSLKFAEFKAKYTMQEDETGDPKGSVVFGFDLQNFERK